MIQDNCQEKEIDFVKTFVPIARLESIRIMLACILSWFCCRSNGCEKCIP